MTNKANLVRRVTFDKHERAQALVLATAAAESRNAYAEFVDERLKARGVETENATWNYEPLTGIAVRTQ